MAFHDVRLPEDVETGAKGGPSFQTAIIGLSGGAEQRIAVWEQARAAWDIGYGIQSPDEFEPVEAFFYARRAKLHAFRFRDHHDYRCTGEALGTGTGTKRTFLMVKTYEAAGPAPFVRRITRPVAGTVNVYVNGLLADPGSYDVAIAGGWIRFHVGSAPPNGQAVTYDCLFDIPVRFDVDNLDLTLYWIQAGQIPSIPVLEIRDIVNQAPTVSLINTVTTISESQSMVAHFRVADIVVNDDPFGEDVLSLTGTDAAFFELGGTLDSDGTGVSLYLKAGTVLNNSIKGAYSVVVNVVDTSLSNTPATASFTLSVVGVEAAPQLALTNLHASLAWNEDTTSHVRVADVVVTQHNAGATNNILSLTGANAAVFELGSTSGHNFTTSLYIKAGTAGAPDAMTPVHYDVTVNVSNADFASPPQDSKSLTVTFGIAGSTTTDNTSGAHTFTVPEYQTLVIEGWGGGAGAPGTNSAGTPGGNTTLTAKGLSALGGQSPALLVAGITGAGVYNTQGGPGGTASGGDENHTGNSGANGFAKREVASTSIVTSGAGGASLGTGGGPGAAGVSATAPAAPFTGDPCAPSPPSPYPVPGTSNGTDGIDAGGPGDGGSGCAVCDWEIVLSLANGYCWKLFAQGRPGAGAGGHFKKTYTRSVTAGAPVPGDVLSYNVGAKGLGGSDTNNGGDGGAGRMKFVVS